MSPRGEIAHPRAPSKRPDDRAVNHLGADASQPMLTRRAGLKDAPDRSYTAPAGSADSRRDFGPSSAQHATRGASAWTITMENRSVASPFFREEMPSRVEKPPPGRVASLKFSR